MFINFKDYINETIDSAALKDQIDLTARQIAKSGGEVESAGIDVYAKTLAKLYHARVASVKKMLQDKVKEHSK